MLYPTSKSPFSADVFKAPPKEYRGAPLWSWNTRLDIPQLLSQIEALDEMGLGGFHIHPRTGLATEYLGSEYMAAVKACRDKGKELGMRCFLYDEDRWPSGAAGGLVTKDPELGIRFLRWTQTPYEVPYPTDTFLWPPRSTEGSKVLGYYSINLNEGRLEGFSRHDTPIPGAWIAYLERSAGTPWFNGNPYVDCLNPKAIKRFIEVTHERYREAIGEDFGGIVPSIFTDEPQFGGKGEFKRPEDTEDLVFPFTDDLPNSFKAQYGVDLLDHLPELFWEKADGEPSVVRYRFHDHVCERFTEAFADQVGDWCEKHGTLLTGHMMEESTLHKQSCVLGEAMRSYRSFQIPGIDMLCDWFELATAKQAQSAVRQYGREGMLSELYGVTNWDFDFAGHKRQGDWQAALGVTLRVHHLTWVSMLGEAKRDYPASIGPQSPWFKEYSVVEDHFARLNSVLTRGTPVVRVGVIHPVESFWLAYGPLSQTGSERQELETNFDNIIRWLLFGAIDFDFISESLLPDQVGEIDDSLQVGVMQYDAILVPACRTLRSTTLDILSRFTGKLIFLGEPPIYMDGVKVDPLHRFSAGRVAEGQEKSSPVNIPFSKSRVLAELENLREITFRAKDGQLTDTLLHQIRKEGSSRWVFICNTDRFESKPDVEILFPGQWQVHQLDTLSGSIRPISAESLEGKTRLIHTFPAHGSLLLKLQPGKPTKVSAKPARKEHARLPGSAMPISLSEPNVLLLDQAKFKIDDGPWEGSEETLRIENILRKRLGLSENVGDIAQPWADREPKPALAQVILAFEFESEVEVHDALLAVEEPAAKSITFNGQEINEKVGFYTDEAIRTLRLPNIHKGLNRLEIKLEFNRLTTLEWCYILGDFGVKVAGSSAIITGPIRNLHFGDWTSQGLPFYGGNVIYHTNLVAPTGNYILALPHFKAPLLSVSLNGQQPVPVAFAPFEADLGPLKAGKHKLDITAFGSRINTFGQVHNANTRLTWFGPGSWRTQGADYSFEYQLKPCGVLSAPLVLVSD